MPPIQLGLPLALLVGAAIAATTGPSRREALLATEPLSSERHAAFLDGHAGMRMLRIAIEPGASLPWHRHMLPNAGYLLEGELRVETHHGTEVVMRPGDTVSGNRDAVRRGTAGPQGATILMFYANVQGQPVTLTEA